MLIKNGTVLLDASHIMKGHLLIRDGKIVEILYELPTESTQFGKVIDAGNMLVAPGLINGHTHSYANFFKTTADGLTLETMMFYISAEGACLTPEDVYYNTMLGAMEMIRGGITSCLDQLAQNEEGLDAAMSAYRDIGMRVTIAPMFSDKNYYETLPINLKKLSGEKTTYHGQSADELLSINLRFLEKWHGKENRLKVGFGPSGPQRCSKEFMQKSMAYAVKYNTVCHTHTLETRIQKNTAHLFFGKPMVEYLKDIQCLNEHLTMAHGVWITPREAELIAESGAAIVHCPACNLYLGSGIAPLNDFRKMGIHVGLGTDGPNGGCNQSMLETMKLAGLLHRRNELNPRNWPLAKEIFTMATVNNAKIIGEEHHLGKIEKGQLADIVIYDPGKSFALQPMTDPSMQIAFGETGNAVKTVIVNGTVVFDQERFTQINEKEIKKNIEKRAKTVNARLNEKKVFIEKNIVELNDILSRDF